MVEPYADSLARNSGESSGGDPAGTHPFRNTRYFAIIA